MVLHRIDLIIGMEITIIHPEILQRPDVKLRAYIKNIKYLHLEVQELM